MKRIKIFGERNSGTNYLHQLISRHTNVVLLRGVGIDHPLFYKVELLKDLHFLMTSPWNMGWKHRLVDSSKISKHRLTKSTGFVTITKHPAAFLLSLHRNPYHAYGKVPEDFSEFIRSPWKTRRREHMDGATLEHPLKLWNKKNRAYIRLKEDLSHQVLNFRYESLLLDPEAALRELTDFFNIQLAGSFENINESTKNDGRDFNEICAYYLGEKWRQNVTKQDMLFIQKEADADVVAAFDYRF